MEKEVNIKGVEPVHFDSLKPTEPLPQDPHAKQEKEKTPEINLSTNTPKRDPENVPQKKNIFLLTVFGIITLGLYPALWYLGKAPEFYNLGTEEKLRRRLPLTLLIFNILLLALVITLPLTITIDMGVFYQHLTSLQIGLIATIGITFLLAILFTLINAFRTHTIINQALEGKGSKTKISKILTLFLGYLYLQYEINRVLDDREDMPRKAPWIVLILVIILGIASSFIPIFS